MTNRVPINVKRRGVTSVRDTVWAVYRVIKVFAVVKVLTVYSEFIVFQSRPSEAFMHFCYQSAIPKTRNPSNQMKCSVVHRLQQYQGLSESNNDISLPAILFNWRNETTPVVAKMESNLRIRIIKVVKITAKAG